jgi:hypothetical protein
MNRSLTALAFIACAWPAAARAQAPPTAPLVLTQPSSARVTALGGAWVAGRDQDVIFSNPAQLVGVRTDFSLSLARFGPSARGGSLTSAYAGGKMSFTLGWGLQVASLNVPIGAAPPYSANRLLAGADNALLRATADAQSAVATVAGAVQYKTFKIGVAAKYAADRADANHGAFLFDVGAARNLFNGVAAIAVQNLGPSTLDDLPAARLPRQFAAGWSTTRPAGPLDLALFTQITRRTAWTGAAAGLEAGYSWIEGYLVTFRAGVRRPETTEELPLALGAAFSADRLTLEYAVRLFKDNRGTHVVTIRWR